MLTRIRIIALFLSGLMVLPGCAGGAFGGIESVSETVESAEVVREVAHYDRGDRGDTFEISVTLPEEWAGQVETINNGSVVAFNQIIEGGFNEPLFTIHVLSFEQMWEQGGSYPGDYRLLNHQNGTYFMYHIPVEGQVATYDAITGASQAAEVITAEYRADFDMVVDIMQTFEFEVTN